MSRGAGADGTAAGRRPVPDAETGAIALRVPLHALICTDIIPADEQGGSGRVAWETAKGLAAMGHRVSVLTKGAKGARARDTADGVEIYRYFSNPFRLLRAVRGIKAKGRIDLMNLNHPYTGLLARLAAGKLPSVYMFHSPWGEEFAIRCADLRRSKLHAVLGAAARSLVEKAALACCGAVVTASRFMADRLKAAHGVDSMVLPLGVDTARFSPAADRAALRARLGLPADKFLIFTVRNLVSRMGLENLVEAASLLVKKEPEVYFVIGGRGYLRERLEELIRSAGLSGNVRLAGFIPEGDLQAYYQCADLFVLPTAALEGFGLVTLEALSCGTPVLATPVSANLEVLGGFGAEFLFKSASPADISSGIQAFIRDYGRDGEALRARCRRFVEQNYSWEKYAEKVEKVFYQVIGD